jgi:hypothetical protein
VELAIPVLILTIVLLFSPFFLAFAAPADDFYPRSLYAFASVHAFFAVLPLDLALALSPIALRGILGLAASFLVSVTLIIVNSLELNKLAIDENLAWLDDSMATNRIIYRIESILPQTALSPAGPIPLVVNYEKPMPSGARGWGNWARAQPWSREWIFRLLDHRMQPIFGLDGKNAVRDRVLRNISKHGIWPAPDSVYVEDGVVVVNIN